MSKLIKLKEWITLTDAAKYLSAIFEEEIIEADVLRFALEDHLILSINFVNYTVARAGYIVCTDQEAKNASLRDGFQGGVKFLNSRNKHFDSDNQIFIYQDRPGSIKGIWDLPMIGGEKRYVEEQYHALIGGPEVINYFFDFCFIKDLNGTTYIIQTWDGDNREIYDLEFYEATRFPSDSVLVVRTMALSEFVQSVAEADNKNSGQIKESTRKTDNLLRALASIAIDDYCYDPKSLKSTAPQDIADAMSKQGVIFDPKTIRNWLKEGSELLASDRDKD